MKPTLHLPEGHDGPRVIEAKQNVMAALGEADPSMLGFALRLAEDRDQWLNVKKRQIGA